MSSGKLHTPCKTLFVGKGMNQRVGHTFNPVRVLKDDTMTKQSLRQEVTGTRAGCIIRYTCPSCHTENAIINKTPKDFYKKTRDARCHTCRKCSIVMTQGANHKPGYSSGKPA